MPAPDTMAAPVSHEARDPAVLRAQQPEDRGDEHQRGGEAEPRRRDDPERARRRVMSSQEEPGTDRDEPLHGDDDAVDAEPRVRHSRLDESTHPRPADVMLERGEREGEEGEVEEVERVGHYWSCEAVSGELGETAGARRPAFVLPPSADAGYDLRA